MRYCRRIERDALVILVPSGICARTLAPLNPSPPEMAYSCPQHLHTRAEAIASPAVTSGRCVSGHKPPSAGLYRQPRLAGEPPGTAISVLRLPCRVSTRCSGIRPVCVRRKWKLIPRLIPRCTGLQLAIRTAASSVQLAWHTPEATSSPVIHRRWAKGVVYSRRPALQVRRLPKPAPQSVPSTACDVLGITSFQPLCLFE